MWSHRATYVLRNWMSKGRKTWQSTRKTLLLRSARDMHWMLHQSYVLLLCHYCPVHQFWPSGNACTTFHHVKPQQCEILVAVHAWFSSSCTAHS